MTSPRHTAPKNLEKKITDLISLCEVSLNLVELMFIVIPKSFIDGFGPQK